MRSVRRPRASHANARATASTRSGRRQQCEEYSEERGIWLEKRRIYALDGGAFRENVWESRL
jgi:hypothetical protein